jgi:hypothetical protein
LFSLHTPECLTCTPAWPCRHHHITQGQRVRQLAQRWLLLLLLLLLTLQKQTK